MGKTKYRVVHYLNQFFGQKGREEKADIGFIVENGAVGPGIALQNNLGNNGEVVATVICGDNYFSTNLEKATEEAVNIIADFKPDIFIAGPAFEAGRYGISCGAICKAVEERLKIPAITGMYLENPGVELFRRNCYIVQTGNTAAKMANDLKRMVEIAFKIIDGGDSSILLSGNNIRRPSEDGYFPRGVVKNEFTGESSAKRGVDMLISKIAGKEFKSELVLPKFEKVAPPPAIGKPSNCEFVLISDGGLCPKGNPDGFSGRGNAVWAKYDIESFFPSDPAAGEYEIVHTGYFPVEILESICRLVPVDVMRELEDEGVIGKLHKSFYSTSGNATVAQKCSKIGDEIGADLKKVGIDAAILTST
jgi:glycine reductase